MATRVRSYVKKRLDFNNLSSSLRLLCLLHEKAPLSQTEAAGILELSSGACNLHFQRLHYEGLIHQVDTRGEGRGRPTQIWDVDRERNACITLVFDVPFLEARLSDFSGKVIAETREDLSEMSDQKALIACIDAFVTGAVEGLRGRKGHIRQAFCALPGLLHPETGKVLSAVNLPILNGLDLEQMFRQRFGITCHAGSLGTAFYHGEVEGRDSDGMTMLIYWDLGIGVVFGQKHRIMTLHTNGHRASSLISELGHVRIEREGNPCHCGRTGCLEAHVGGWALLQAVGDPSIRTIAHLVEAVGTGNERAREATSNAARLLGKQLAWPIQLMNVTQIIISGPLAPAVTSAIDDFRDGLGSVFPPIEIERLNLLVSEAPATHVQRGAFKMAKRLFLYPDEFQEFIRKPGGST